MNFKTLLHTVNTFIFDVDGVISDEKVYFLGDEPIKSFNNKDAYALQLAIKKGYRIAIISGGKSVAIKNRLEKLGITNLFFSVYDKLQCYKDFISENTLEESKILYMGDDLPDWELMKRVGVPVCPKDAATEIKEICIYVSTRNGGNGCVRDVIEQTMRCQNNWEIGKW